MDLNAWNQYFLALQVCLQLEALLLITGAGLWADQLFNTYVAAITNHSPTYQALIISYGIVSA